MIIIVIVVLFAFVIATPAFVMWLWNWLMPYLFQTPIINYWQALGLMMLASLLFYRPSGTKSNK